MEIITNWLGAVSNDEFFVAGMAFAVAIMFFGALIELPFAFREMALARQREHMCELHRCGSLFQEPCHYSGCPCHKDCPFYEKFSFMSWIRKEIKKP